MIDFADNNEPKKKETKSSGTPVLDNFGKELNILAEKGKLDPMIGRDAEVNRIAQILTRRKKNNPIIIGPSGGGKTTLVEGLVMKIVNGDCPKALFDKRIFGYKFNSCRYKISWPIRGKNESNHRRTPSQPKYHPFYR
jgi:ATP-dependent Clp protease ATP-binding subunit ClpC